MNSDDELLARQARRQRYRSQEAPQQSFWKDKVSRSVGVIAALANAGSNVTFSLYFISGIAGVFTGELLPTAVLVGSMAVKAISAPTAGSSFIAEAHRLHTKIVEKLTFKVLRKTDDGFDKKHNVEYLATQGAEIRRNFKLNDARVFIQEPIQYVFAALLGPLLLPLALPGVSQLLITAMTASVLLPHTCAIAIDYVTRTAEENRRVKKRTDSQARLFETIGRDIESSPKVQAFGHAIAIVDAVGSALDRFKKHSIRMHRHQMWSYELLFNIASLGYVLPVGIALFANKHGLVPGELVTAESLAVSFATLNLTLMKPLATLRGSISSFRQAREIARRHSEAIDDDTDRTLTRADLETGIEMGQENSVLLTNVKRIELSAEPGCLVVLGPSGIGKSTMLDLLFKGDPRLAKEVFFTHSNGERVKLSDLDDIERSHIFSRYFQKGWLYGSTVGEAMSMAQQDSDVPLTDKEIIKALSLVGLETRLCDREGRFNGGMSTKELSGGEITRLALAVAIAKGGVMLLDEPFEGADPHTRSELIETIRAISRRGNVILVTHSPLDAIELNGRVWVLDENVFPTKGFRKHSGPGSVHLMQELSDPRLGTIVPGRFRDMCKLQNLASYRDALPIPYEWIVQSSIVSKGAPGILEVVVPQWRPGDPLPKRFEWKGPVFQLAQYVPAGFGGGGGTILPGDVSLPRPRNGTNLLICVDLIDMNVINNRPNVQPLSPQTHESFENSIIQMGKVVRAFGVTPLSSLPANYVPSGYNAYSVDAVIEALGVSRNSHPALVSRTHPEELVVVFHKSYLPPQMAALEPLMLTKPIRVISSINRGIHNDSGDDASSYDFTDSMPFEEGEVIKLREGELVRFAGWKSSFPLPSHGLQPESRAYPLRSVIKALGIEGWEPPLDALHSPHELVVIFGANAVPPELDQYTPLKSRTQQHTSFSV